MGQRPQKLCLKLNCRMTDEFTSPERTLRPPSALQLPDSDRTHPPAATEEGTSGHCSDAGLKRSPSSAAAHDKGRCARSKGTEVLTPRHSDCGEPIAADSFSRAKPGCFTL